MPRQPSDHDDVVIENERLLIDDVFGLREAMVSIKRDDGRFAPPVRRLSLERGDSVAAVIVDIERQVAVLVRQFRYPAAKHASPWLTELVAGIVDPGEDPTEAIAREIAEEAGLDVRRTEPVGWFYLSPGGSSERLFLYYVEVTPSDTIDPSIRPRDPEEEIELVEVALDELGELLDRPGAVVDAKTVIGLNWLVARNRARAGGDNPGGGT